MFNFTSKIKSVYRQARHFLLTLGRRVGLRLHGQREKLPLDTIRFGLKGRDVFFGYYDLSPFDLNNRRILAVSAPAHNRLPRLDDFVQVGYFYLDKPGQFHRFGETNAWSRQQGCRLQWYPKNEAGKNDRVLYNYREGDHIRSKIVDINTAMDVQCYSLPVYDVSSDGKYALSIDFTGIYNFRRHYGYTGHSCGDSNSIKKINMADGNVVDLIHINDVLKIGYEDAMDSAVHHLDHISISPDGAHFLFFHIWHTGNKKGTRMFFADEHGGSLRQLILGNRISHYCWIDNQSIVVYCVWQGIGAYWFVNIMSGKMSQIHDELLIEDGHPTAFCHGKYILTDTYPDLAGHQKLILYDTRYEKSTVLGRFYSPIRYTGEVRCDLHPRLSSDASLICVDSSRDGKRAIYVSPLKNTIG